MRRSVSFPFRRCVCAAVAPGFRAGVDRRPHWNRQGRTGRRPSGRGRPCQLAGADWRAGDADHERERATALPGAASGTCTCSTSSSRDSRTYHEEDIRIGAGATIERTAVLNVAGLAESVVVEGAGSRIEARDPGFGTRFGPEDLKAIPTRRVEHVRLHQGRPGVSPTSPGSGTATTVSAFGSGTNENQFLIDGTNFTCPCNGIARAEPGVDFIQEVQVQSVGASAEFGNVQGAVINVVTRQGSERFLYDASYYGQTAGLTSQPVRRPVPSSGRRQSGYERDRYRDLTTNLGGPAIRDRLWFFAGYQYLRDYDSQPGTDPAVPEDLRAEQDLREAHVATGSGLAVGSKHPRRVLGQPRATHVREAVRSDHCALHASVPAITFGHLTHTSSAEYRVGCARRTVRLRPRRRPEHGQSDDAEPVRPRDGCLRAARRKPSAD